MPTTFAFLPTKVRPKNMNRIKLLLFQLLITQIGYTQIINSEFADTLIDAYYSNANKDFDNFYGGTLKKFPMLMEPNQVIGNNTKNFLSLPIGSYIILGFTDNVIIDYPNQDDIHITETGCSGEQAEVYVSNDGVDYVKLGIVDDCKTSSLDLKTINFKSFVKFIKIIGIDSKGRSPGFDLVNVKGLPNSNISKYINSDSIVPFLSNPDTIFSRKIILQDINFNMNSDDLTLNSKLILDTFVTKLLLYPDIRIKITGHTDNVGNNEYNLNLSKDRAKSVKDYLVSKGVKENRIEIDGKGETEPLKSNETESNRSINRRVEFEIIE